MRSSEGSWELVLRSAIISVQKLRIFCLNCHLVTGVPSYVLGSLGLTGSQHEMLTQGNYPLSPIKQKQKKVPYNFFISNGSCGQCGGHF
jgi:hypothetical protein